MRRKPANLAALIVFLAAALYFVITEQKDAQKGRPQPGGGENHASVTAVSDGDTLSVVLGGRQEKIRMIGIDAPELGQRPWGARSKKQLEKMVEQSMHTVRVELDAEERDKYGRVLAYVFTQEGLLVNEELLRSGLAVLYTFPPNVKYVDRFTSAQKYAQESRTGIWGKGGLAQTPSDYRKAHPR